MKDRVSYTYVILRYRHDPASGESVNVGVVLHAPAANFLGGKVRHTIGRLKSTFPDIDSSRFKRSIRVIEDAINQASLLRRSSDLLGSLKDARGVATEVLVHDDSSLVWSETRSGITADPTSTLESLFNRFVGQYDLQPAKHKDDESVWKPIREELASRHIAHQFEPKTIKSSIEAVEFQHSWKNGSWHCFQPLSFDLSSSDSIKEKAHRWAGQLMSLSDATDKFRPYFIVGRPSEYGLLEAYDAALKILALPPQKPKVFEESDAEEVVGLITDMVAAHPKT